MKIVITLLPMIILMILINLTTLQGLAYSRTTTSNYYNVVSLGAKPNSETDASKALKVAWELACGSTGRSTIYIPQGRFVVRNALQFSGKECMTSGITFVIKGAIVAPTDFRVLGNSKIWIWFDNVDGVTINGGVFDGEGRGLWACKRSRQGGCPRGVTTLSFTNSMNIELNGVTSLNSQLFHIAINGCKNVKLQGMKVLAPGNSPNTDGIHVQSSTSVTILNTHIGTGDDCISIGAGATNLWMQDITCGPGHGISIGSLGKALHEEGVQNIMVKSVTFINTQNGVRIKSWGKPSDGFVRNVVFQQLTMVNAQNPIIIDQNYCPGHKNCPGQASGVKISNISYKDIRGSSATPIAVKFDCSSKYPCLGINMKNVKLTYNDEAPLATCVNSGGSTLGVIQPKSCLY